MYEVDEIVKEMRELHRKKKWVWKAIQDRINAINWSNKKESMKHAYILALAKWKFLSSTRYKDRISAPEHGSLCGLCFYYDKGCSVKDSYCPLSGGPFFNCCTEFVDYIEKKSSKNAERVYNRILKAWLEDIKLIK